MAFKLKPEYEAFGVMDGPMAGKKYDGNGVYTQIPAGSENKFEVIPERIPGPEEADLQSASSPTAGDVSSAEVVETEEEQARRIFEATRPSKLKKNLDRMGVKYPAKAVKSVLIDLLLKSFLPVPRPAEEPEKEVLESASGTPEETMGTDLKSAPDPDKETVSPDPEKGDKK